MKKRLFALALTLTLLCGCGGSPAKKEPPAPDTPKRTEAPAPTQKPADSSAPTEAPKPIETPAPTEAPAPSPEENPLLLAEGIYRLYSSETEGYASLASESGAEAWITLRRSGAADYMGPDADGAYREWRGIPCMVDAEGTFRFEVPDDFIAYDMSGRIGDDKLLELSLSWRNPDGSSGGSTLCFKRVRMNDGAEVGQYNGIKLAGDQLSDLKTVIDPACMAFCTCIYSCPEEIDWTQVFYDGAGLTEEPGDAAMEEYLQDGGWGELDMECIREDSLREFVWKNTLTSYDLAEHPLFPRWFRSSDGCYMFEHGDTNAIPIDIYEAYADYDLYKLFYMRSNWENYVFDQVPFVLTVYIRDGQWQYVSNLPADWPEPKTLLTMSYYGDLADAQTVNNLTETIEVEQEPWMEPYGWSWAVFTAQEDGVRWIVEQADDHVDEGYDVLIPGEYVASGVLNRGESAAVHTNQPWHTEMRLIATGGGQYYSEYVFGQDNWKHLNDGDTRRIVAHDLAGEGRGCAPRTEAELSSFLRDGNWALLDKTTGELAAAVQFRDYRYLTVCNTDGGFNAFLNFDRYDARPTQAPDLISLEYAEYSENGLQLPGYTDREMIGDYQLYMIQLDGEQVLTLTQVSEGEGILSVFCPEADEGGVFTLHRYKGATEEEGQG